MELYPKGGHQITSLFFLGMSVFLIVVYGFGFPYFGFYRDSFHEVEVVEISTTSGYSFLLKNGKRIYPETLPGIKRTANNHGWFMGKLASKASYSYRVAVGGIVIVSANEVLWDRLSISCLVLFNLGIWFLSGFCEDDLSSEPKKCKPA